MFNYVLLRLFKKIAILKEIPPTKVEVWVEVITQIPQNPQKHLWECLWQLWCDVVSLYLILFLRLRLDIPEYPVTRYYPPSIEPRLLNRRCFPSSDQTFHHLTSFHTFPLLSLFE